MGQQASCDWWVAPIRGGGTSRVKSRENTHLMFVVGVVERVRADKPEGPRQSCRRREQLHWYGWQLEGEEKEESTHWMCKGREEGLLEG